MAITAEIALLSPVTRVAVPAASVVSQAGPAFAAVLGQVAAVRNAQVKLPADQLSANGTPGNRLGSVAVAFTHAKEETPGKEAASAAAQPCPVTTRAAAAPVAKPLPQNGQSSFTEYTSSLVNAGVEPILAPIASPTPIRTVMSPPAMSAAAAPMPGRKDQLAGATGLATTIPAVAKSTALPRGTPSLYSTRLPASGPLQASGAVTAPHRPGSEKAASRPTTLQIQMQVSSSIVAALQPVTVGVASPRRIVSSQQATSTHPNASGQRQPLVPTTRFTNPVERFGQAATSPAHTLFSPQIATVSQPVANASASSQSIVTNLPEAAANPVIVKPRVTPAVASTSVPHIGKTTKVSDEQATLQTQAPAATDLATPATANIASAVAMIAVPPQPATRATAASELSQFTAAPVIAPPLLLAADQPARSATTETSSAHGSQLSAAAPHVTPAPSRLPFAVATSPTKTATAAPDQQGLQPDRHLENLSAAATTDIAPAAQAVSTPRPIAPFQPAAFADRDSTTAPQPVAATTLTSSSLPPVREVAPTPLPAFATPAGAPANSPPFAEAALPAQPAHATSRGDVAPQAAPIDYAAIAGSPKQPLPTETSAVFVPPSAPNFTATVDTTPLVTPGLQTAAATAGQPISVPPGSAIPTLQLSAATPPAAKTPHIAAIPVTQHAPMLASDDLLTAATLPAYLQSDQPALAATPVHTSPTAAKDARQSRESAAAAASPTFAAPAPQAQAGTPNLQADIRDAVFQPHPPDKDTQTTPTAGASAAALLGSATPSATTIASPTNTATPQPAVSNAPPTPPPAAQIANAVATLHVGADGTSHVTIRLDPAELGHVQIRISRAADGTASVNVAVERPDTLATLQNDIGHLHQALDHAGIPDQRSVTMHLAAQPDQAGSTSLGTGTGSHSGFTQQGGFQQGARQQHQAASQSAPATAMPASLSTTMHQRPAAIAGSGVNITA